jgi:hypothetical protein
MFVLSSLIYSDKCYAQTQPTSADWVSFVFTCVDSPSEPYFEINFPGGTITNPSYNNYHFGIDFDPTPGANWVSPSGNDLLAYPHSISDYRGFGFADFTGRDASGNTVFARVYFVECCFGEVPPSGTKIYAEPEKLSFWNSSGNITGESIMILGNIDVDLNFDIHTCDMLMGTDARLYLETDMSLANTQTEYKSFCRNYWDGIHAHFESNTLSFSSECKVFDGLRAVYLRNDASFECNNTTFDNNPIAVIVINYSASNYFDFTENFVLGSNNYLTHNQHSSSPIDISQYQVVNSPAFNNNPIFPNDFGQGIFISQCENIEIKQDNYFESNNTHYFHIACQNTNLEIYENTFIGSVEALRTFSANILFGDLLDPNLENLVENCGMWIENSGMFMANNTFEGNTTSSIFIRNPSQFSSSSPIAEGLIIRENHFTDYANIHIQNQSSFSEDRFYTIDLNTIVRTEIICENLNYNSSSQNRLRIEENQIFVMTFISNHVNNCIKLVNCEKPRVSENYIRGNASSSPSNTAIYVESSPNSQILQNYIFLLPIEPPPLPQDYFSFENGVVFKGDCTGSELYCNSFNNPKNAIVFDGATLSDFGGASPIYGANNIFSYPMSFINQMINSVTGNLSNNITYFYYDQSGNQANPDIYWFTNPWEKTVSVTNGVISDDDSGEEGCPSLPSFLLSQQDFFETTTSSINFQLFPNPSNGTVHFKSETASNILIKDLNGKIIFHRKNCSDEIIEHNLPKGLYIFSIEQNGQITNKKLIVN